MRFIAMNSVVCTWDRILSCVSPGLRVDWLESSLAEKDPGVLEDKLDESAAFLSSAYVDCVLNCAGKSVASKMREIAILLSEC